MNKTELTHACLRQTDSLAILAGLFANAPVAFQIFLPDGKSIFYNRAFQELFDCDPLLDYNILRDKFLLARGFLPMVKSAFAGEPVQTPVVWRLPKRRAHLADSPNKRKAVSASFFPVLAEGRAVRLVAVIYKDETRVETEWEKLEAERRHLKDWMAKLEQAEQRFRLLIEHSSDMITLIDANGNLIYASPSSNRILRGGDSFEDRSAFEFVHPNDMQKAFEVIQKTKDHPGVPIFDTIRLKTTSGQIIVAEGILTNLLHVPGVNGIIINFRDVTERRQMEQKLLEREAHLIASQRIAKVGSWELDLTDLEDLNRNRLLWSDECYRIFGYEPGQVVASNELFFKAIPPQEHDLIQTAVKRAIETGKTYSIEHRVLLPDGQERIVHERSDVLFDPETGKPMKMIGTVQDITERRLSEEKLREAERQVQEQYALLRGIISNFDSPIFSVDTDYCYTSFNHAHATAAKMMFGADLKIGDKALACIDNQNDVKRFMEKMTRSMQGEKLSEEFHFGNIEAPDAWLEGQSSPIKNDQGEIIGVSVYYKNITKRRQAEDEIRRLNTSLERRVQERTAELESFTYTVSHDLRAPLRIIDAFSQLLIKRHGDKLPQEALEFLTQIRSSGKCMAQIIEGLLTLSRMACRDIQHTPVNLSELFHSIAVKLQATQPERQVNFIIEPGLTVKADANMMYILLENLLENAWKYSSKHAWARIEFGFGEMNGEQFYFVKDDGAGFDMAQAGRLFKSFQRLHAQTEFEGTGIGLATVLRIVQRHGGRVWAEGAVDKGATVYFTLPGKKLLVNQPFHPIEEASVQVF